MEQSLRIDRCVDHLLRRYDKTCVWTFVWCSV
jgi:hypothetical protein